MSEENNYLHNILYSASISFILGGIGYVLMFFSKLFAARYFGSTNFGFFSLVETVIGFAVVISSLGFADGISRYVSFYFYSKDFKLLNGFIDFVFKTTFISSIILGLLFFIFSKDIVHFFNLDSSLAYYLKLVAIIIPLRTVLGVIYSIFTARNKYVFSAFSYHLIEKVIFLIGVVLILVFHLSLTWLFLFFILSILCSFIFSGTIYLRLFFNKIKSTKLFKRKEWLYYSLPLLFSGFFAFLLSWTDNLVIGKFLVAADVGIYAVAYSLASFILFFQTSFATFFLPSLSEDVAKTNGKNISFIFKRSAFWIFSLTLPLVLIFVLFGKKVLFILYGSDYVFGYVSLLILSIGFLINISMGLSNYVLSVFKKTKTIFYINLAIALFNLFLTIVLVHILGIEGAAISSALSMAIQNILFYLFARKNVLLSFDFKSSIKFLIITLISALGAWSILLLNLSAIISIILFVLIFFTSLIILTILFKVFSKEDVALFESFVGQIIILNFIKRLL